MLLQVVLAPVVLKFAGQEVLGAYSYLMQAIAWAALTDLGLSVAISRNLAQAHSLSDNQTRFSQVFTTGRTFFLGSNLVMAALIFAMGLKASSLMHLSADVAAQAQHSLVILAVWVVCRTPLTLFDSALYATQQMATVNLVVALSTMVRLGLALLFVSKGMALLGMIFAYIIGEALTLILSRFIFLRQYQGHHFGWGFPNRSLFREMFAFGLTCFLMGIASRLSANTDNLIVGTFLGSAAVSVYYTSQMPGMLLGGLIWKLADNASPAMNELHATGQNDRLLAVYLGLFRYSLLVTILVALGICAFNKAVVLLWVGEKQYAGLLFSILVGAFVVTQVINHLNAITLVVYGRMRGMTIVCIITGLCKIALAGALAKGMGLSGVMVANLAADLAVLIYLCQSCWALEGLALARIWSEVLRPCLFTCILPGLGVVWLIWADNTPADVLGVALRISGIVLVWAVGGWFFGLKASERTKIFGLMSRIIKGERIAANL
jgi:O-antigen/teichoic acid export membrane protein